MRYTEKARYSALAKMGFLFLLVVFAFLWSNLIHIGIPFSGLIVLTIGSAIMVLMFRFFFNMEFGITDSEVVASLGEYDYHIPLKHIENIRVTDVPIYEGLGVMMHNGKMAFISNHDRGVELKLKSGPYREVLLTAKDPQKFMAKIRKAMKDSE